MDAFSEILSQVKLDGAVFFTAEFSAPWGFSAPPSSVLAELVAPGAAHLMIYRLITAGRAFVETADGPAVQLRAG